jgi:hypothetical protein
MAQTDEGVSVWPPIRMLKMLSRLVEKLDRGEEAWKATQLLQETRFFDRNSNKQATQLNAIVGAQEDIEKDTREVSSLPTRGLIETVSKSSLSV